MVRSSLGEYNSSNKDWNRQEFVPDFEKSVRKIQPATERMDKLLAEMGDPAALSANGRFNPQKPGFTRVITPLAACMQGFNENYSQKPDFEKDTMKRNLSIIMTE